MDGAFFMAYTGLAQDIMMGEPWLIAGGYGGTLDPLNIGIVSYGSNVTFYEMTVISENAPVPEPLTVMSALIGLGMIGGYVRKRRAA